MRRRRVLWLSMIGLMWCLVLASPPAGAGPVSVERVALARGPGGALEATVTGPGGTTRIVGLGFGVSDRVWAALRDIDADGDRDVLIANVPRSTGVRGTSPGSFARLADVSLPIGSVPTIYTIVAPAAGLPPILDAGDGHGQLQSGSRRGDNDNFGYGGEDPPPCVFFDNREPEDHVFDYETLGGDEVDQWKHDFPVLGEPTGVKFVTWEIFSDLEASTIDLDGHTLLFATEPFARCEYGPGGLRRVFLLTGSDASIAADGTIALTFSENSDDIALDKSQLAVTFA